VDHVQHGGFYLQARTNPQERLELREGSRFLGWREVPSPHLERIRGTHMGGTDIVVVEGLNPPDPFVIRFASTPLANQAYESNQQLEHFARAAGELPLTLRRFPRAGASRPAALRALPPARGASAVEAMRSGRLVLVAYPDTPFFEAMVLGVPTIGLWNPAHWEPRPDAAPALRALTDAGIVFDSPEQAAARVREVHPRADDWWASDEVADARGLFIARFAPPGDWLAVWSAYLRAMSA
jgi:putative transferase (TIGR04331 family)